MKTGLWCGGVISLAPWSFIFRIIIQYPLFIACHNFFFQNMESFHHTSVENFMRKYSQEGFVHLTYVNVNPNIKVINIARLVQVTFKAWFGCFDYSGYLLGGKHWCSQWVSGLDCHQPLYLTTEYCLVWNLQHETSQTTFDMFHQSWHLLHTEDKLFAPFFFFLHCNYVLTFLEIMKHNMPKCCFFSLFNIKNGYIKIHQFDVFSKKCMLIWQLWQSNKISSFFTFSKNPIYHSQVLKVHCTFKTAFMHFVYSVQFSHSVMSDSLWPHESQHARPPCPSPTPRVHSNSCPLRRWFHPAISSSVVPFSSCPMGSQKSWTWLSD